MLRKPSMQELSGALRAAAVEVATRLERAGHRTYLVGGAVRDLALGLEAKDADLCSAARPEEIEALFEHTVPLGKAFGTIQIRVAGQELEHTTFRSESGYSDRRRPDQVRFGASVSEDAQRRDFCCNALYLDPLSDEFLDPTGGWEDLRLGRLRCVGEPQARFAEDGLRILRMARFAAALELAVAPGLLEAARDCVSALDGVAGERVLAEFDKVFQAPAAARALALLEACGALQQIFPGWRGVQLSALEQQPQPLGLALGLALCFQRTPQALTTLKLGRELSTQLHEAWRLAPALSAIAHGPRSTQIFAARSVGFELAVELLRRNELLDPDTQRYAQAMAALGPAGLHPQAWLNSADLAAAGLPRGPRWGATLREAEVLQLNGELENREAALRWLSSQAQDGGKL